LFREDKALVHQSLSSHAAAEELRKQIGERFEKREKISTSVDITLDKDAKRVLAFASRLRKNARFQQRVAYRRQVLRVRL
jgi:hypothetical protein